MSLPVAPPSRARAARDSRADRGRFAWTAAIAVASAALLLLLADGSVGPMHWLSSLVAIGMALGVVVAAQLTWERAINTAESEGLVEPSYPQRALKSRIG